MLHAYVVANASIGQSTDVCADKQAVLETYTVETPAGSPQLAFGICLFLAPPWKWSLCYLLSICGR